MNWPIIQKTTPRTVSDDSIAAWETIYPTNHTIGKPPHLALKSSDILKICGLATITKPSLKQIVKH